MNDMDRTFRRLKRISYDDMSDIYNDWSHNSGGEIPKEDLFQSHGWTWAEFIEAMLERLNNFYINP